MVTEGGAYASRVEIERIQRPFWMHQLVEYLIGLALVSVAVQQPQPAVPALLAVVVIVNAAVATGAAGAFRLVGPRLHRRLDLVVVALLVAGAVQPWFSLDNLGRIVLGATAFVLLFVWFHTDFRERTPRASRSGRSSTAGSTADSGSAPPGRSAADDVSRAAGRAVGRGIESLKQRKNPEP